ncbi:MAG: hypothetical protein QOC94_1514 [Actinoplanes sp.]|nr:hypothetical protein [Actinoplanes sp.]
MKSARRTLVAIGAFGMTYAVLGALTDADVKGGALMFLIGVLIAHDGLFLPIAIAEGALAGRLTRPRSHAFVRSALVISLAVTIVAFPLVLGKGRAADNPSLLPLHYGRGLLEVYAIIWAGAGVAAGVRRWRTRGERRSTPEPEPAPRSSPGRIG